MKESTIRTVLRRLEQKGYVAHAVNGRTFIYRAAELRQNVAVRAVKNIIDRFCGGSAEELVIGMVDNAVLGPQATRAIGPENRPTKGSKAMIVSSIPQRGGEFSHSHGGCRGSVNCAGLHCCDGCVRCYAGEECFGATECVESGAVRRADHAVFGGFPACRLRLDCRRKWGGGSRRFRFAYRASKCGDERRMRARLSANRRSSTKFSLIVTFRILTPTPFRENRELSAASDRVAANGKCAGFAAAEIRAFSVWARYGLDRKRSLAAMPWIALAVTTYLLVTLGFLIPFCDWVDSECAARTCGAARSRSTSAGAPFIARTLVGN